MKIRFDNYSSSNSLITDNALSENEYIIDIDAHLIFMT